MLEIAELLKKAVAACESLDLPYMVVGSVASMAYGEYRATNDIDIVIQLDPKIAGDFCRQFPEPDFYVSEAAAHEAIRLERMFNVIENRTGYKVDFAISQNSAWGRAQLERRRREEILPSVMGYLASPEDVIISKMLFYRDGQSEKHLRDIAAMVLVSGETFDKEYLKNWILRLQLTDIWQAIQRRLDDERQRGSSG
jgi:hypothetical protein